ncbi:hypothetical protein AAG570_001094 [Ranatra chinensis]|uniref:Uncharacterized protein n=1 Tax=Ranatra chinensis TaxID=642074 RepID=A0ABD0YTF9_9HEMI
MDMLQHLACAIVTSELPTDQQSAVWGLRCVVCLEYGYQGSKSALEFSRRAVELYDRETEWHFYVAKCLGRERRKTFPYRSPDSAELEEFRIAYYWDRESARYTVHLASAIHNQAINLFYMVEDKKTVMHTNAGQAIKDGYYDALKLYYKALRLNKDRCLHVMIRCARGLSFLPGHFKDITRAKELNAVCLQRSPTNVMVNHNIAMCFLIEKKIDVALIYLLRASELGCYGASLTALEVAVQLDKTGSFDPAPTYRKLLQDFPEKECKILTSIHAVTYYILICQNVMPALEHFMRAVNIDHNHPSLKGFKLHWLKIGVLLNIYELVGNEVKCAIRDNNYSGTEELKQLRGVIFMLQKIAPEVLCGEPEKGMVNQMRNRSILIEENWLKRRKQMLRRDERKKKRNMAKKTKTTKESRSGNEWMTVKLTGKRSRSNGRFSGCDESERYWKLIKRRSVRTTRSGDGESNSIIFKKDECTSVKEGSRKSSGYRSSDMSGAREHPVRNKQDNWRCYKSDTDIGRESTKKSDYCRKIEASNSGVGEPSKTMSSVKSDKSDTDIRGACVKSGLGGTEKEGRCGGSWRVAQSHQMASTKGTYMSLNTSDTTGIFAKYKGESDSSRVPDARVRALNPGGSPGVGEQSRSTVGWRTTFGQERCYSNSKRRHVTSGSDSSDVEVFSNRNERWRGEYYSNSRRQQTISDSDSTDIGDPSSRMKSWRVADRQGGHYSGSRRQQTISDSDSTDIGDLSNRMRSWHVADRQGERYSGSRRQQIVSDSDSTDIEDPSSRMDRCRVAGRQGGRYSGSRRQQIVSDSDSTDIEDLSNRMDRWNFYR